MDPGSITLALRAVSAAQQSLAAYKLRAKIDEIQAAVESVDRRLSEEVVIDLRTALTHLEAALRTGRSEVRGNELSHARRLFARLINRPAGQSVKGVSSTVMAEDLKALGHWGNYYYFLLMADQRQALMEAYRSVEANPELALQLFPERILSKDYAAEITELRRKRAVAAEEQREARKQRRLTGEEKAVLAAKVSGWAALGFVAVAAGPAAVIGAIVHIREVIVKSQPSATPRELEKEAEGRRLDTAIQAWKDELLVEVRAGIRVLEVR
ncbi:hypothetical protein [Streptosporangium sp. NPDC006007]|uniref:hypothetical protein n=1 Tax=Streptosporangium sp. NPDC006007 TaxID=3154575 RepID=UPI0033B4EBBE